ncbi:MAG: HAMP domain-containing sensor histidine kinase [Thermodesulfobacteriota bacterium]
MKRAFSLRTKIFLGILVPAALLCLAMALDYRNIGELGKSARLILSRNYKSIQAAQEIRQYLEDERNQLLATLVPFQPEETRRGNPGAEITRLLRICRDNVTEQGEQAVVSRLIETHDEYRRLMARLEAEAAPSPALHKELFSLAASLVSDTGDLVLINERAMEKAEKETERLAERALKESMGLLVAAILCTLAFSYLFASGVSKPLRSLAAVLSGVKEGSGTYPNIPVETRDEIGFLTSEFNRLFERLKVFDQLSADKLTAEKMKVRQAEAAKERFIADLSHQLKTPMTSLAMSVGILADQEGRISREDLHQLLETARQDCARLADLINELVSMTRLEGMGRPRAKESLDVEALVQESLRPLRHQAAERRVDLVVEVEAGLRPLAVDSLRFPWVLANLAGNAIRYTDAGGKVLIRVHEQDGRYYFQCRDTGRGIEPKYLDKIFDRFTQFYEREKSGTIGLGLAIVKEIIEQHGGDIRVESEVGKGTSFTFWVPVRQEQNGEERPDH